MALADAEPLARWEAVLRGLRPDVVKQFAVALSAEGLDPSDPATVELLGQDLLDRLGLRHPGARVRVLGLTRTGAVAEGPPAVAAPGGHPAEAEPRQPQRGGCEGGMPGLGATGRCFRASTRFGPDAQEVVPGVFLGNFKAAEDAECQQSMGVTHIVNATSYAVRSAPGVAVLCLGLRDGDGDQDISKHFRPVNQLIREAREAGGAVLVHCIRGVSRSSALVCAFLVEDGGLSAAEALAVVQRARPVAKPRTGFREQLRRFEVELRRGRRPSRTSTSSPDAKGTAEGAAAPSTPDRPSLAPDMPKRPQRRWGKASAT